MQKKIWLASVSYPVSISAFLERAFGKEHQVTTLGPKISQEIITELNIEHLKDQLHDPDHILSGHNDLKKLTASLPKDQAPELYLWVESAVSYIPFNHKSLDCPKACYFLYSHLNLDDHLEWAKKFDHVFVAQRSFIPAFKDAGIRNVHWLPVACDPEIHSRQSLLKKYDVGFAGTIEQGSRREMLINRLRAKFNVGFGGRYSPETSVLYSQSKTIFNSAVKNDLNRRVFEALSMGSMLVTDNPGNSGLSELFVDGEDLCLYEDNELEEKIAFYLERPILREKIAQRGRQLVQKAHTHDHRCKDLLAVIDGARQTTSDAAELRDRSLGKAVHPVQKPKNEFTIDDIKNFSCPSNEKRSIIIPVLDLSSQSEYNFHTLLRDLESIEGEVIVIFNSVEMAEQFHSHPRITYSASMSHNVGVARAWNIGLDMATTPTAFIINSDLHITPEAIETLEKALHELPEAAVVGPEGSYVDFSTSSDIERYIHDSFDKPMVVDNVSGFFFAVKTEYFHSGTLIFENKFTPCYFEEWDLGLQIKRAGLRAYIVPTKGYEHEFNTLTRKGKIKYLREEETLLEITERNQILFWQKWLKISEHSEDKSFLVSRWYLIETEKGESLITQNKLPEARTVFTRIVKQDPHDFLGNFYLGLINYRMSNLPEAQHFFEVALETNPKSKEAKQFWEEVKKARG